MCFLKKIILLMMIIQLSLCDDMIELSCKSDSDCSSYKDKMTLSTCLNSNCRCLRINTGTPVDCTPKKVIVNNKIGDCRANSCDVPNSSCDSDFKCACKEGFIMSSDGMRCIVAIVQLNQPCEMNEQCVRFDKHAVCNEGVCQCLKNFTMHDNSCRSLVKIDEHCESQAECHKFTTNVTCLNHRCACDEGFVSSHNGDSCLPNANYLESCAQDNQCENGLGPGSVCDSGKCVCDSIHRNITDKMRVVCQRTVLHGDGCKEHSECSRYLAEVTMHCFQNKCQCRDGYELFDAFQHECVKISGASAHTQNVLLCVFVIVILSLVNHF